MAGSNIKGITVEINGETGPLQTALRDVNNTSRDLQKELREVEKGLKLDPGNVVLLQQKQELLAKSITNTKEKLATLKTAEEQAQASFAQGRISEEQYRALQREVINTEQSLERLETQAIQSNAVLSSDEATGNLKKMAVAAGAAAVAVGAAFVGMGVAAMNNADELQRQSDVTGLSAERLQELQYAGNNLGVELDVITGAQAKLTKSMDAAKEGTGAQAEAFKTLGINVLDGNGHLKSAKDVMGEAFTALGKIGNETERDALSMKLFGKSAMEMNPMIKAGGDELNRLTEEAKNNGAVMSNEAVSGLDTFGDTMDNLKSSILGSVGEALAGMMPKLQGILDKMMQLPQWIKENSTLLTIIGVVIGTVTSLVIAFNIQQALLAKGLTLWGWIMGGVTTATTALGTAFAFLTSPIGLIIIAIGLLVAGFVYLWNNCEGFRTFWIDLWEGIKSTTKIAVDAIVNFFTVVVPEAFNSFINIVTALPGQISTFFTQIPTIVADAITTAFNTVIKWGTDLLAWVAETVPKVINNILTFFNELPGKLGTALGVAIGTVIKFGVDLVAWVATNIPIIIGNIITFFSELPGKIATVFKNVLDKIISWGSNVINWIVINIPKIVGRIINFYAELPGKIATVFKNVLDKIIDWGTNIISWATNTIPGIVTTIVSFFLDLPAKMLDIGVNIVKGIWDGIKNTTGWLMDKVAEFADGIVTGIKDTLGIQSPSRVMAEVGDYTVQGLAKGIENSKYLVANAMNSLGTDMAIRINPTMMGANKISQLHNDPSKDNIRSSNGLSQVTQNFYSPIALSPSETARQNKRALQELALGF